MMKSESGKSITSVCDFNYLSEMMSRKKQLIIEIMDIFLDQVPIELRAINDAIAKIDYSIIKNFAHKMKSTVSIMGISLLTPILNEMEELGSRAVNIEKIKELNQQLNLICEQAIEEIEKEKLA